MCSDLYCMTVFPNICITFVSSLFSMRSKNLLHWRDGFSTLPIISSLLPVPRPGQIIILTWFSTWSFLPKLWRYLSAYPETKSLHNVPTSSFVLSFCFLSRIHIFYRISFFVCLLAFWCNSVVTTCKLAFVLPSPFWWSHSRRFCLVPRSCDFFSVLFFDWLYCCFPLFMKNLC